jgi:hypothetical protein
MKKIIATFILGLTSSFSFAGNQYFFAQDLRLEQKTDQNIFFKNVVIHFTRPCWAKYVDVVEKVIWEDAQNGKNPTRYRLGLAVLLEGDSKGSTCLGFSNEQKGFEFNVYRMQESDFVEFVKMESFANSNVVNDAEKRSRNGAESNGGKQD